MLARYTFWVSCSLVLALFGTLRYYLPRDQLFPLHTTESLNPSRPSPPIEVPRKVWQTWTGSKRLGEEPLKLSRTWIEMNPNYGYELLTDDSAHDYVEKNFRESPLIMETWDRITDPILRADLIRYLALLVDGGVYTDIDTDCSRPIEDWVPAEYRETANLVVGIEYDARKEELRGDMDVRVQLCQWTLMAKAGSTALQHVVTRVIDKLREVGGEDEAITAMHNGGNVLDLTGPRIFTRAVLESLTSSLGEPISYDNITMLEKPKLIGDVLIMPISSFASGQEHSGSKPWGNEDQLMSHHFLGFSTWKLDHAENEEQKAP